MLYPVYIEELFWLSTSIKEKCEELWNIEKLPDKGYTIKVDLKTMSIVKSIVDDTFQLKNILWPRGAIKTEKQQTKEFRNKRGSTIRKIFDDLDLSEIKNENIRNSLEHFDERLDKYNLELKQKLNKKGLNIIFNMILSEREAINPFPIPFRVLIIKEKSLYNFNFKLDLDKVYSECSQIVERLINMPERKNIKEPGGLFLPLIKFTK